MLGEQNLDKTHDMGPGVFKGANPCVMFNTTIATKKYVPVQDRAKLYAYGGISPRAKRLWCQSDNTSIMTVVQSWTLHRHVWQSMNR